MKRVTAFALALALGSGAALMASSGSALAADEFYIVHGTGTTPEQRACQVVDKRPADDGKQALIKGDGANANGSYTDKQVALAAMSKLCPGGIWTQGSALTK